ncbi:MAG: biopolymer transporter ExbD [Phycisphaerales bacterium]|nr:biopolymer transporter ExbD [Phycisphaerales bacterium]
MMKVRRDDFDVRIEMMPLIDVIFLILTFFLYAMVLMVRVDMVPVPLEHYASGEPAEPAPAAAVVLRTNGTIHVGKTEVSLADLQHHLQGLLDDAPDTTIYLVLEDGQGTVDRGPMLTAVWDRLRRADIDIRLVGRPEDTAP